MTLYLPEMRGRINFLRFGLAMNMVGALTYMHSKFLTVKEKFEIAQEMEAELEKSENPEDSYEEDF